MKFIINHTYIDMKVLSLFYTWLKNVCVSKWSSIYDGSFSFFLWVCVARVLDKSSTKRFYLKFFMNFKHYSFLFIYFKYIIWYIYAIIIANEPPHISIPSIRQRKQENLECPVYKAHLSCCFDLQIWLFGYMLHAAGCHNISQNFHWGDLAVLQVDFHLALIYSMHT